MLNLNYKNIEDIELELSGFCNASCPLCARNYKNFNIKYPKLFHRDYEDIISQLNIFPNLKIVRLVGSISEPTLYKDFFKLIEFLNSKNIDIEICTNGDTHDNIWWNTLGKLLKKSDKVYFTICGSTQELHEIYRRGTKLSNILSHAAEIRKYLPIDFAQCIKFEYNEHDFKTEKFKDLIKQFSNVYLTETYLKQDVNIYKDITNIEILNPPISKKNSYNIIKKLSINSNHNLVKTVNDYNCKSIKQKSLQIDLYGNIFPCYLYLEQNDKWDKNYNEIINNKACNFCKKNISILCKNIDGEYII